MAFDALIDDISSRFDLGSNAGPLIREILAMITGSPGVVSGFLNTLKSAGLSSEVALWLGHANASPLSPQQIDRALGSSVNGIASRLGLLSTLASTAVGYALPRLIGLLTPGGVIPTRLPAEVTNFLSAAPAAAATAELAPRRIDASQSPPARNEPVVTRWLWPVLGALVLLGLGLYFWSTSNRTAVAPPVTQAPPVAPDKAAADKAAADKAAADKAAADKVAADKAAADKAGDLPNIRATGERAALKSGFSANDLTAALNDSVVNFPSGSAEIPASMATFLRSAAEDLKQLPKGHVLEIAGYTDNTGNAEENVALSQKRADAVREALIKGGADPDMLIAKGSTVAPTRSPATTLPKAGSATAASSTMSSRRRDFWESASAQRVLRWG